MTTLANFPFVNQLDGTDNAQMNCVPASTAACIRYLTGKTVTPDQLKDTEYGASYTGGTNFARYHDDNTDLMRTLGCDAESFTSADMGVLVARVHAWLQAGYPVIATIPSQWGTVFPLATRAAGNLSSHVIAFYSEEGGLTAMNPWGAIKHTGSDQYWAERLCYNTVWRVYRTDGGSPMALSIQAASAYFTANADGSWTCRQTGKRVQGSILRFYVNLPFPVAGLFVPGLPLTDELTPQPNVWIQVFERGALVCDPGYVYDRPPGVTGDTYFAHIDAGVVFATLTASLQAKVKEANDLAAKLVALQAVVDAANGNLALETQRADALAASLADAQAQVAALQAQLDDLADLAAFRDLMPTVRSLVAYVKDSTAAAAEAHAQVLDLESKVSL